MFYPTRQLHTLGPTRTCVTSYNKDERATARAPRKKREFDSKLFIAAIFTGAFGVGWMAMAIFAWNIPFFWEATFFGEGGHHGGPINWGIGFLAILLTGIALYPWCYATLFLFWSFFGKPNARRTGETIGGIHLTHFGLIWFWLVFVGPGVYIWWGGMFGIGMDPEGWYWTLIVPSIFMTGLSVQGLFWGLYLIFRGTPDARDQTERESEIQSKIIEQATKSGELVKKPLKNWWEE